MVAANSPKAYWAVLSIDHDGAGTGDIVTFSISKRRV
jgi:hypothetical protein